MPVSSTIVLNGALGILHMLASVRQALEGRENATHILQYR
jgi:hypothetical protein